MLKQKNQVIEVAGKSYQLTKMDARTGSYVAFKVAGVLAPSGGKSAEMAAALMGMPRKDFDELQSLLLRTVNRLVDNGNGQQLPEPVLTADGSFVDADLAYDAASVIQLTVRALVFNVGGFFAAAGLNVNLADLTDKHTNQ
ncbi:MAG: hypothetical protein SPI35_08085 [Porphyromonas sp.]|nr:hypothetical protein [Porphyromonas sp.]